MTATQTRTVSTPRREPRPFLYLDPKPITSTEIAIDACDLELLNDAVGNRVATVVRSLVNHTIEIQNDRNRLAGFSQPIALSVLNRRRRSARAWIQSILAGNTDTGTLHAFTHTWMPQLAGTGPEIYRAAGIGRRCVEFVRGIITALIFDAPADNLIPQARALNALETTLAVHLQAFRDVVEQSLAGDRI